MKYIMGLLLRWLRGELTLHVRTDGNGGYNLTWGRGD